MADPALTYLSNYTSNFVSICKYFPLKLYSWWGEGAYYKIAVPFPIEKLFYHFDERLSKIQCTFMRMFNPG